MPPVPECFSNLRLHLQSMLDGLMAPLFPGISDCELIQDETQAGIGGSNVQP